MAKITIPEYEQVGMSPINVLNSTICILDYSIERLSLKYKLNTINDIKGYSVTFLSKLITSFKTLVLIIEDKTDSVVAYGVLRILVDNIAVFKLIYENTNEDELVFRHYLYILDGASERLKQLSIPVIDNGKIEKEEYNALKKQVEDVILSEQNNIQFINKQLEGHKYFTSNNVAFKQIVQTKNWKYKRFIATKNQRTNTLSWKELYGLVDKNNNMANFFSYLSHFIHGLSISNIITPDEDDKFDSINNIGVFLSGCLLKTIKSIFHDEIEFMFEGYLSSIQGLKHMSCYKKGSPFYELLKEVMGTSESV